jgi:hypothetical protein
MRRVPAPLITRSIPPDTPFFSSTTYALCQTNNILDPKPADFEYIQINIIFLHSTNTLILLHITSESVSMS